jgi:hypothetical protein
VASASALTDKTTGYRSENPYKKHDTWSWAIEFCILRNQIWCDLRFFFNKKSKFWPWLTYTEITTIAISPTLSSETWHIQWLTRSIKEKLKPFITQK